MSGAGPRRIVVSSANPDKVAEIAAILREVIGETVELVARPEHVGEVDESGATLEENARLKAEALRDVTGLCAVADDTGLEVDALAGAPGVHSSRYAGERASYAENVEKLLGALAGVTDRRACFRTVALVSCPDGTELVAHGAVEGEIAGRARGSGGFGYDPVFIPDEGDGRSFAEMSPAEKHAISHRGRAFRELARLVAAGALG